MTVPTGLETMFFSQQALELFQRCPLRFRYRYVDGLFWSRFWSAPAPEQTALAKGELFHLLAQRLYSGLDPGLPAEHEWAPVLQAWVAELARFCPPDRPGVVYYPELALRLARGRLRLQAKFDLLAVAADGTAALYDWKTHGRHPWPPQPRDHLQTVVYRYLLCAAGGAYSPLRSFAPEQVSLVYWNPQFPTDPVRLPYSAVAYAQDARRLHTDMEQILAAAAAGQFPPTADTRVCNGCEYRPLCHGQSQGAAGTDEDEFREDEFDRWMAGPPE